jgi:hypothetical protein
MEPKFASAPFLSQINPVNSLKPSTIKISSNNSPIINISGKISILHSGDYEELRLLGCYSLFLL